MVMDDAWLAEPRKRSRLRLLLAVTLAAALVFLAGVEVQKRYGVAGAADTATAATGGLTGGPPAGFTPPGSDQEAAQAAGSDSGAASSGAAVIGTVVSVKDGVWTVKDLGGTVHEVTVGDAARIVRETTLAADQVAAGATVDISGTTDDQGRVTATTITVR
jgi:hypothetical protein